MHSGECIFEVFPEWGNYVLSRWEKQYKYNASVVGWLFAIEIKNAVIFFLRILRIVELMP